LSRIVDECKPLGSGSIDRGEFLMRDGLAETIVASMGMS
jgi:hypothetical protein